MTSHQISKTLFLSAIAVVAIEGFRISHGHYENSVWSVISEYFKEYYFNHNDKVEGLKQDSEEVEADEDEGEPVNRKIYLNGSWRVDYKLIQNPIYDAVILGDSRMGVGVMPGILRKHNAKFSFFNFAMNGIALTSDYFEAAERLINPQSRNKVIIIGLSPPGLTDSPDRRQKLTGGIVPSKKFLSWLEKNKEENKSPLFQSDLFYDKSYNVRHGWFHNKGSKEAAPPLRKYHRIFRFWPISPNRIDTLEKTIKRWTSKGIRVFVLRTPVAFAVKQIENEEGLFEEEEIKKRLEGVGARWLDMDDGRYLWFDGIHQKPASARIFSEDLGILLSSFLGEH